MHAFEDLDVQEIGGSRADSAGNNILFESRTTLNDTRAPSAFATIRGRRSTKPFGAPSPPQVSSRAFQRPARVCTDSHWTTFLCDRSYWKSPDPRLPSESLRYPWSGPRVVAESLKKHDPWATPESITCRMTRAIGCVKGAGSEEKNREEMFRVPQPSESIERPEKVSHLGFYSTGCF